MAGELIAPIGITGWTVYNMVFDYAGLVWNTALAAFETYAAGSVTDYDVASTEQGASGIYIGDFPSAIVAAAHGKTYRVVSRRRAGGTPAESDSIIATGEIAWKIDEQGVKLADAVTHGGASAILDLQKVIVTATGSDGAVTLIGAGDGNALQLYSTGTGYGILTNAGVYLRGNVSGSGIALSIIADTLSNGHGLVIQGAGSGSGLKLTGGFTGVDIDADIFNTLRTFYKCVATSAVNDASATATAFVTNLAEATTDHFQNMICVFTDGALQYQPRKISAYNGTTKQITVSTAYTDAPGDTDEFAILGLIL